MAQQDLDLLVPQCKAGARPDVASALRTFEHETARALLQELLEQPGRRNMQERGDAEVLERARLQRPAAGNQRHWRPESPHDFELLVAQRGGHEPEDAHAPRATRELQRHFRQQRFHFAAAHQRERGKGQSTRIGDRHGEGHTIADACHRALQDRVAQAEIGGERAVGRQRLLPLRGREVTGDGAVDAGDDAADGAETLRQRSRKCRVLPCGQQVVTQIRAAQQCRDVGRLRQGFHREVGPLVDAKSVQDRSFTAIHRRDCGTNLPRQRYVARERQLAVEDHTRCTAGDACCRGVQADAALHPDRTRTCRHQGLQQHQRGFLAHPAAAFVALGDQCIGAVCNGRARLCERGHLDKNLAVAPRGNGDAGLQDDGGDTRRQRCRGDVASHTHAHPGSHRPADAQLFQRMHGRRMIVTEVEHTQRPRQTCGNDDAHVGLPKRIDCDDSSKWQRHVASLRVATDRARLTWNRSKIMGAGAAGKA